MSSLPDHDGRRMRKSSDYHAADKDSPVKRPHTKKLKHDDKENHQVIRLTDIDTDDESSLSTSSDDSSDYEQDSLVKGPPKEIKANVRVYKFSHYEQESSVKGPSKKNKAKPKPRACVSSRRSSSPNKANAPERVYKFSDYDPVKATSKKNKAQPTPRARMKTHWRGTPLHPTACSTRWPGDRLFCKPNRDNCYGICCYKPGLVCEHNDPKTTYRRVQFTMNPQRHQERDTADRGKDTCYGFLSDYKEYDTGFGPVATRSAYVDDECE